MNLFAQAKQVQTVTTTQPNHELIVEGVKLLAQIQAVMQAIGAVYSTVEAEVKDAAKTIYVERGVSSHRQPDNFDIYEDNCSANYQMRKRSSRSVLTQSEVDVLTNASVSFEMAVTQKEMYTINPAYTNNQELLQKISDRISRIPDLPSDFIQYISEEVKPVTTNTSIDDVFRNTRDIESARALLDIVGVQAMRIRSDNGDISEGLRVISSMID